MAKRHYFKKALPPAPPPERSPEWDKRGVVGILEFGGTRIYDPQWLRRLLGNSKGGKTAHARGRANKFTTEQARKAIKKRWRTRNRLVKGIRIGLKKQSPKLDYAALRNRYAIPRDGWRVRYDVAQRQWYVRDGLGERKCSERTALQCAGHLKRPTMMARIPRQFRGINLDKEGWNRD